MTAIVLLALDLRTLVASLPPLFTHVQADLGLFGFAAGLLTTLPVLAFGSLRDEVIKWQVVHLGSLVFIGLMGAALYLLVRDLPGRAARISRLAIGAFVLFYGAGEAILGVATCVLVQHANDVPAEERTGAAHAANALWDNPISDDVLITIGGIAWVVATVAAAVAYRRVGAPTVVRAPLRR